jgi:hypothetical protein
MNGYLTIDDVAERLGIGRRTLDGWLASDLNRMPDDRRFQFHVRHGGRRLWTEERYKALEAAIERESEPGGVLGVSKSKSATAIGTSQAPFAPTAVQSAFAAVMNFPLRPPPTMQRRKKSGS